MREILQEVLVGLLVETEALLDAVLRINYVGVWDTVAAIGVLTDFLFAKYANKDEQYFDSDPNPLVVSARHAVAIDEDRTTFAPTLWPNFQDLNASLGCASASADAPYQQKWFPGHHGSVGGGGGIWGLSDRALVWVLDGAERMGLQVDRDPGCPLDAAKPDDLAPLDNMMPAPPTFRGEAEAVLMHRTPREHGPTRMEEVSESALPPLARARRAPPGEEAVPAQAAGGRGGADRRCCGIGLTAAPGAGGCARAAEAHARRAV